MKFLKLDFLDKALVDPKLIKQDKDWLTHIRPAIALVKPSRVNPKLIADIVKENKDNVLGIVGGTEITGMHIIRILQILHEYPRSELVSDPQTEVPHYSAAVPIGLLAYKEHHGKPYSVWKGTSIFEPWIFRALVGPALADIDIVTDYLTDLPNKKPIENETEVGDQEYADSLGTELSEAVYPFDHEQQLIWRELALRDGMVKTANYGKLGRVKPSDPMGSDYFSKFYWCMVTQTWIFDPSIRHPDMITDLSNWDNAVTPLVDVSVKTNASPFADIKKPAPREQCPF